jgi:hypothetical protein
VLAAAAEQLPDMSRGQPAGPEIALEVVEPEHAPALLRCPGYRRRDGVPASRADQRVTGQRDLHRLERHPALARE